MYSSKLLKCTTCERLHHHHHILRLVLRALSTTSPRREHVHLPRIVVTSSEVLDDASQDPNFRARKAPGHFNVKKVNLPPKLKSAAETIIKSQGHDLGLRNILTGGKELQNRLWNRRPPIEEHEYKEIADKTEAEVKEQHAYIDQFLTEKERKDLEAADERKIKRKLKGQVYHWEPIDFTTKNIAFTYLVGRTPGEYAALYRIFSEIAQRDSGFKPETLFDFGSGVGSVVWAANQFWKKSLKEHVLVDMSDEMTNLAELLLKCGSPKNATEFNGIYFRRLLPTSAHRKYDITVCSNTLFELASLKERIGTIDMLWKKTSKYMVLVEQGTNAGFKVLNEVRDYLLQLHDESFNVEDLDFEAGHVFSPCPHDFSCPRLRTDNTPCNFSIRHETLVPFAKTHEAVETYSYLVLQKGSRDKEDPRWPRFVRAPLCRPRHVVCRLCTKYGKLSEVVISKGKYPKHLYRTARTSQWGDLLPVDEITPDSHSLDFTEEDAEMLSNSIEENKLPDEPTDKTDK